MNRLYPRTKFADENTALKQLKHIESEISEFRQELIWQRPKNPKALILEAHDIIQSAYTLMDILEREYPGQAWAAREEMIEKNRLRGYYSEGELVDGNSGTGNPGRASIQS